MNIHAKNIFWVYFFTFAAMPLGYLIRVMYASNLSVEDYGIFYGLFGFFAFFEIFRNWGMPAAINFYTNKFLAEEDSSKVKSLYLFAHVFRFLSSFLIIAVLYFSRHWIFSNFYPTEKHIEPIFNLFLLFWGIQCFSTINSNYLSIFQNQKVNGFMNFLLLFFVLVFSLLFFGGQNNYIIPVAVYLFAQILIVILEFGYVLKTYSKYVIKPVTQFSKKFFLPIVKYATVFIPLSFANTIFVTTDTLIIQYFEGAEKVAFYATAVATAELLLTFFNPLLKVLNPLIAKLWHTGNKKTISKLLSDFINHIFILLFPLSFFVALFSKNIILAIFGEKFLPSVFLLSILSCVVFFKGLRLIFGGTLSAIGQPKKLHKTIWSVGAFNLIGNLILVNFLGVLGVMITTAISFILFFVFLFKEVNQEIPIYFNLWYIIKILILALLFLLTAYFLKESIYFQVSTKPLINFIVNGCIIFTLSSGVYMGLLFWTKTLTKQKFLVLKQILLGRN